jgi:hypothetical protein
MKRKTIDTRATCELPPHIVLSRSDRQEYHLNPNRMIGSITEEAIMTISPDVDELYTYLDKNYIRFDGWGCLVALSDDRGSIFWCVLFDGEPDREGDHMNWGLVTAPEPEFLNDVNLKFGTAFKMKQFSGR